MRMECNKYFKVFAAFEESVSWLYYTYVGHCTQNTKSINVKELMDKHALYGQHMVSGCVINLNNLKQYV